jgi:hypothetical protein
MTPSGIILGYHGCEAGLARKVVLRETTLRPSANGYDWLGQGIYFWAHDPVRAQEWPEKQRKQGHELAVIGAAIDLGRCLNLAERHAVEQVKEAYLWLKEGFHTLGRLGDMPVNRGVRRMLDNRVLEALHDLRNERGLAAYDTVIGYFGEGPPIYEGAELRLQDHLQICVRTQASVLGCFLADRVGTVAGALE